MARHTRPAAISDLVDAARPAAPDAVGQLLRFRRSSTRLPGIQPWVVLFADGRVEQWELDDERSGRRVAARRMQPQELASAAAQAQQVLRFQRPALRAAHDPTECLELVVQVDGEERSAQFLWGQDSGRDAPLDPVTGAGAIEAFDALASTLLRLSIVDHSGPAPGPASAAAASPVPTARRPDSAAEIARALVAEPPSRLSALERVVGTVDFCSSPHDGLGSIYRPTLGARAGARCSARVRSLHVEYHWDRYRERPYALDDGRTDRDPALLSYHLSFEVGWLRRRKQLAAVRAALSTTSPAEPLAETPYGPGARHGAFYLFNDGQTLAWYPETPDWARPRPDESGRMRWLGELGALLARDCDHAALAALASAPPTGIGVRPIGALNRDDYQLALEPGIDAVACARALGLAEALATSGDTHGQTWYLVVPGGPDDVHDFVQPRVGCWIVEAVLEATPWETSPQGIRSERIGSWPVYDLAHCPPRTVNRLFVWPRQRA